MFDLDRFIEECRAAVAEDPSHEATPITFYARS